MGSSGLSGRSGRGKSLLGECERGFFLYDALSRRTSWQSDIDLTGEQRPQSVYREIMWENTGKSGIYTTHPKHFGENFGGQTGIGIDVNDCWYFEDCWLGKPVKVDIYGAIEKLMATMDISYAPGVLDGIVYKEGKEISRCRLVTPGKAAKLELCPEDTVIQADGKRLPGICAGDFDG